MISLACFNRRFTPNWRMSILTLFAILFFSRLGFWQIHRAEEKEQMMLAQSSLAKLAPLDWQSSSSLPKQYQPIRLNGHYLAKNLLLDNQHYQHQLGFHVLTPLLVESGKVVLVDRGWVASEPGREILPEISTPQGLVQLAGTAYFPSAKSWVLGQILEKRRGNISIVEQIDTQLISQFLHKSVYPFIMRLNDEGSNEFVREWPVVAMSPKRHYAYAFQWFAIASLILILFIVLNLKTNYENN